MLEIKPNCENCGNALPNGSTEAMICTFECTFCNACVTQVLHNVCPNCGGGFERRPTRPAHLLEKHPVSKTKIVKAVDAEKFKAMLSKYKDIEPEKR